MLPTMVLGYWCLCVVVSDALGYCILVCSFSGASMKGGDAVDKSTELDVCYRYRMCVEGARVAMGTVRVCCVGMDPMVPMWTPWYPYGPIWTPWYPVSPGQLH